MRDATTKDALALAGTMITLHMPGKHDQRTHGRGGVQTSAVDASTERKVKRAAITAGTVAAVVPETALVAGALGYLAWRRGRRGGGRGRQGSGRAACRTDWPDAEVVMERHQQLMDQFLDAYARRSAEKYQRFMREQDVFFDNADAGMSRSLRRDFQVYQFRMAKRLAREFHIGFTFERRRWQFSEHPWSVARGVEEAELRRFRRAVERHLRRLWAARRRGAK
jgi:hypothetical protein